MEENYETLRMPELRTLAREHELRGYSRLRRAELIAFLQNNRQNVSPQMEDKDEGVGVAQLESKQPALTKRQLNCRCAKDSKLAMRFKNMNPEIDNLKSRLETLEDKIATSSRSTNTRFKKKKIRSMKCEVDKVAEKLRESEGKLKLLEPIGGASHPPSRSKHIERKIADLNKKIRRAKNGRNK